MLAEFLEALRLLSLKAAEPTLVHDGDSEMIYMLPGGQQITVEVPPPPRSHKAGSLDDIVALANRFKKEDLPVVWHDDRAVVLVIDDPDHRVETATLTLDQSDLFAILVDLRRNPGKAWKDPRDFVRLIRVDLAGAFRDESLLQAVRKLKFEGGNSTTAESARGRESLGKEIHARVEQAVPEEVVLEVPVYKTAGLMDKFPLRCTVEVDPLRCILQLLPFPDEVERVVQLAVSMIAGELAAGLDKEIPVYQGKP